MLLYVEVLEDNEALFVEDAHQIGHIIEDSNKKSHIETLETPRKVC